MHNKGDDGGLPYRALEAILRADNSLHRIAIALEEVHKLLSEAVDGDDTGSESKKGSN